MKQGLFVFERGALRCHLFAPDQPVLDHAAWFATLGLPDHGPAFDALVRGRVTLDPEGDRAVVGVYGAAYLSNPRFRQVVEAFALDEGRVVEKRLSEPG